MIEHCTKEKDLAASARSFSYSLMRDGKVELSKNSELFMPVGQLHAGYAELDPGLLLL